MRLVDFVQKTNMVDLAAFPKEHVGKLMEALERDPSLAALDDAWRQVLGPVPMTHVQRLSEACLAWREREEVVREEQERARREGRSEPPATTLERALVPHKVRAAFRAVALCPRSDFDSEDEWAAALGACVDAWSGAVNQALRRGELKCHVDQGHPEAARFAEFARRSESLSGLPGHRWLALRRAERLGAVRLLFRWPKSSILGLVESFKPRMGPILAARETEDVAQQLVFDHLEGAVRAVLDRRVEDEAIRTAVAAYSDLLTSPPLAAPPVGAVAVSASGEEIGVAVVGDEGQVVSTAVVGRQGWERPLLKALSGHRIEVVVLPTSAPDMEFLVALRNLLAVHYGVSAVRSAALAEARQALEPELQAAPIVVQSAVVLARRALDPAGEWAKVNPVSLGLAEYQNEMETSRLEAALKDALALHRWSVERSGGPKPARQPRPEVRPVRGKLNPLVGGIRDLKPGMAVRGVVVNVTNFGAFVDLGLEEQAFVHVSELSREFVRSPHDVVRVGQEVSGWVLDLDLDKKRVALTLKGPPTERRLRSRRGSTDKLETLARLESLFKK